MTFGKRLAQLNDQCFAQVQHNTDSEEFASAIIKDVFAILLEQGRIAQTAEARKATLDAYQEIHKHFEVEKLNEPHS